MRRQIERRTLTDTGPIVAMIDSNDKNHDRCWHALASLPETGLVTPTACLVEILYLLGKPRGQNLRPKLWALVNSGVLALHVETVKDCLEAGKLMDKYADIPMDYADAVIVGAANHLNVQTIFTLDQHFYAYRKADGTAFTVVP